MKEKLTWLKTRLREIGRTPTALAHALGIAPPRVYEMIAGRRNIQIREVVPMAQFLGWTMEEMVEYLPKNIKAQVLMETEKTEAVKKTEPDKKPANGVLPQWQPKLHETPDRLSWLENVPSPVHEDEIVKAVLEMITDRFRGRPILRDTIERGLALACFEIKLAGISRASRKTEVGPLRIA